MSHDAAYKMRILLLTALFAAGGEEHLSTL